MTTDIKTKERFYLVTIDLLKGFVIFPMILGHGVQWYYQTLAIRYEEGSLAVFVIIATGLMVFPCFLFIYGFNLINSFLRKGKDTSYHPNIRVRAIKRSLIFLFIATLGQVLMSVIRSPGNPELILNYILTWHLFHVFSFSTIALLLIWQLAWFLKKLKLKWDLDYVQYLRISLSISLIIILFLFIFFHSYTLEREISSPIPIDPLVVLERAILDTGSYGLIPWLSFSLSGGLIASFLDLTNREILEIRKGDIITIIIGTIFCILGFMSLQIERFVTPALQEPSSFPHVFISIGVITLSTTLLIIFLDLYRKISYETISKIFYPLIIVSNISLTVYLTHTLISFLDPTIIPSEPIFLILAFFYALLFVIIAHFWQRWEFKYSLEWIIRKYS
ncbi:MAG: hypothetical protein ACFE9L_21940, partial [Candidatus Hodarchaeota archaeon]